MDFKTAIEELQKLEDNPKEASLAWPADMNDGYKAGQSAAYANARTLVSNLKHDVEKLQREVSQNEITPNDIRAELNKKYRGNPEHYNQLAERVVNMTEEDVYTITVQFQRCKSDDRCIYTEDWPNMPEKVQALFQFWLELQGTYIDGDFAGHFDFVKK